MRCVKALDGRPIAVSGARDGVIRVWDIQKGICLRTLEGHESSVRALDVAGNVAITGSYDHTARVSSALLAISDMTAGLKFSIDDCYAVVECRYWGVYENLPRP